MPAQGKALGLQSEKYRALNGRDKKVGQPFQGFEKVGQPFQGFDLMFPMPQGVALGWHVCRPLALSA